MQEVTVKTAPKRQQHADPLPPIPASMQHGIDLKILPKKQWQITREPAVKAHTNSLQSSVTYQLNEWRNFQRSDALKSLDSEEQSQWKVKKR
jgi:hypothetical protein